MRSRFVHVPLLSIALVTAWSGLAHAQEEKLEEFHWKAEWHHANVWDYTVVGAGFSLFALEGLVSRRDSAGWQGPILWDSAVRDLVRQDVKSNRDTASTISDVMMTGSLIQNLVFDNLVIALAVHQEPEASWQMTVSAAEAYAIAFALTSWTKTAVGRQRPFQDRCEQDPGYSADCDHPTAYRSFFSGHASTTGVGAGLLCAHHLNMPLYDGGVVDVGMCGMGIALTVATGLMRIASDKHWATDVTMGHLVGFASGYFVPTLLYYTDSEPREAGDTAVLPAISPDELGVRIIGRM